MKLKLDENLGQGLAALLQRAGHDAVRVPEQGLASSPDPEIIDVCHREHRALVTLDKGFADPLQYPPSDYSGIAVLRLPGKPSLEDLAGCVETLIAHLARHDLNGALWIVQRGRVRQYAPIDEASPGRESDDSTPLGS